VKKNLLFVLAFILLSSQVIFADDIANQLADFSAGLDADITIKNETLLQSPQIISVNADIRNPNDEPMSVYLIRQEADGWQIINLLGAIAPKTKSSIGLEISVQYNKLSTARTRYAIVSRERTGPFTGHFSR